MDRKKLIAEVEKKHAFRIPPDDAVFALATISELMLTEATAELQRIMTDGMDQIAAINVQAEAAARAKAELIVTKSGEWGAERIREAGENASARLRADVQAVRADIALAASRAKWATNAALLCSVAALAAAVSTVVAIWVG